MQKKRIFVLEYKSPDMGHFGMYKFDKQVDEAKNYQ